MPTGPQGQKRPADAIGLAVMIGKIATGEVEDDKKISLPMARGKAGGSARSERLMPERRSAISKTAATARWAAKEGAL